MRDTRPRDAVGVGGVRVRREVRMVTDDELLASELTALP
jgi:hypothetical protein